MTQKDNFWQKSTPEEDQALNTNPPLKDEAPKREEKLIDPYMTGFSLPSTQKPIIVLFGPSQIGKTVALLRLVSFLKGRHFSFQLESGARSDAAFEAASDSFNSALISMDSNKPPRTYNLDFLLLTARKEGVRWHVLEAPGEHFFDSDNPNQIDNYPKYLNQVIGCPQKKVYIFFFEENMFKSAMLRKAYAARIGAFVNAKINPKKDKILVLYNKINDNSELLKGGSSVARDLKNEIFNGEDYSAFSNAITQNGGKLKHVPLIPFYSGYFYGSGETGNWSMSPDEYPARLWDALDGLINKRFSFL